MFVFLPGNRLRIALPHDPRSHTQWFADEGWTTALAKCPRGFWDEEGLYCYKGSTFEKVPTPELAPLLRELSHFVPETHFVHNGMYPGPVGEKWKPRIVLGTLKSLLPFT